jgi:hypothetical protein
MISTSRKKQDPKRHPVLERLQGVMEELGIEKELHDQKSLTVAKGNLLTKRRRKRNRVVGQVMAQELGDKLQKSLKSIAVDWRRLKQANLMQCRSVCVWLSPCSTWDESSLIRKPSCQESLERRRKELATTGVGRSDQMLLGDRVRLVDEIAAILK